MDSTRRRAARDLHYHMVCADKLRFAVPERRKRHTYLTRSLVCRLGKCLCHKKLLRAWQRFLCLWFLTSSPFGMAFPLSALLHFPATVYSSTGSTEIAPQLLRSLGPEKLSALQFLKNGKVRVTFKSSDCRDEFLRKSSFPYGDVSVPVTASDVAVRSVFVRDLPVEVADADVQAVFESFVANGTRILLMSFDESTQSIPSSLSVSNFPVRVWHPGQPVICSICREPGHLPQVCPFSGRCLRCKQPGHRARDCKQAWGPLRPSSSVPSSVVPVSQVSPPVTSPVQVPSTPSFSFSAPTSLPVSSVPMSTDSAPVPSPPPSSVHRPVPSPVPVPHVSVDVEEGEIVSEPVQSVSKPVQSVSKPVSKPVSKRLQPVSKPVTRRSDLPRLKQLVFSKVKVGSKYDKVCDLVADIMNSHNLSVPVHEIDDFVKNFCFP